MVDKSATPLTSGISLRIQLNVAMQIKIHALDLKFKLIVIDHNYGISGTRLMIDSNINNYEEIYIISYFRIKIIFGYNTIIFSAITHDF